VARPTVLSAMGCSLAYKIMAPVDAVAGLCVGVHGCRRCVYAAQPQLSRQALCRRRSGKIDIRAPIPVAHTVLQDDPASSRPTRHCAVSCMAPCVYCQPLGCQIHTCHDVAHEAGVCWLAPGEPHRPICSSIPDIRTLQADALLLRRGLPEYRDQLAMAAETAWRAHLQRRAGRPSAQAPTWHSAAGQRPGHPPAQRRVAICTPKGLLINSKQCHRDAGVANSSRLPVDKPLRGWPLTSRRPSSSRFSVQASPQCLATSSALKFLLLDTGSDAELLPFDSRPVCASRLLLLLAAGRPASIAGLLSFLGRCAAGGAPLSVFNGDNAGGAAFACHGTKLVSRLGPEPVDVCASELTTQLECTLEMALLLPSAAGTQVWQLGTASCVHRHHGVCRADQHQSFNH
jgi:hypothetical protein